MNVPSTPSSTGALVVLGDQATADQHQQIRQTAAAQHRDVTHWSTFPDQTLRRAADLSACPAVVDAGAAALRTGCPVWVPYPSDLGCEDNIRRLHLALRRTGVPLLLGPDLTELETSAGLSPLDHALRIEIGHIDNLALEVATAAGAPPLIEEIAEWFTKNTGTQDISTPMPAGDLPWLERASALEAYAHWRVSQGATQHKIATEFNLHGHRTRRGLAWSQAHVSILLTGRYRPSGPALDAEAA